MDACALHARYEENQSVTEHVLHNYHAGVCSRGKRDIQDFMISNPNLRLTDGVGVNGCIIDKETYIFQSALGKPRQRKQLSAREFVAVPNLGRGSVAAGMESQLQQGNDTSLTDRVCDKYGSRDFARILPPPQSCWYMPNTLGPIPVNSKDMMRDLDRACDERKSRAAVAAVACQMRAA
jgi:hypothetical protein